jgi:hypothetical protein
VRSTPFIGEGSDTVFDLGRAQQIAPRSDIRSEGGNYAGSAFTPLNPRKASITGLSPRNDQPEAVPGLRCAGNSSVTERIGAKRASRRERAGLRPLT